MKTQTLTKRIKAHTTTKAYTCLDANRNIHLVLTTSNVWFYFNGTKWKEISPEEAQSYCKIFYFEYRFNEMQSES